MSDFDEKTSEFLERLGIYHNHPAGRKLSKDYPSFNALKDAKLSVDDLVKLGFTAFEANLIRKKTAPKVQPTEEKVQTKSEEKSQSKPTQSEPPKTEQKTQSKPVEQKAQSKPDQAEQTKTEQKSQSKPAQSEQPKPVEKSQTTKPVESQAKITSEEKPQSKTVVVPVQSEPSKTEQQKPQSKSLEQQPKPVEKPQSTKPEEKPQSKPIVVPVQSEPPKTEQQKVQIKPNTQTQPKTEQQKSQTKPQTVEKPVTPIPPIEDPKTIPIQRNPEPNPEKTPESLVQSRGPDNNSDQTLSFSRNSQEGPLQIKVIQEPETKITEKSDRWIILLALPGAKSENIEVSVVEGVLHIKAPLVSTETVKRISIYEKKIRIPQHILSHPSLKNHPLETAVQYDRGFLIIEIKKPEFLKSQFPAISPRKNQFTSVPYGEDQQIAATPLMELPSTKPKAVEFPNEKKNSPYSVSIPLRKKEEEDQSRAPAIRKVVNPEAVSNNKRKLEQTNVEQNGQRRKQINTEHPVYSKPTRTRPFLWDHQDDFDQVFDSFFNDDFFPHRAAHSALHNPLINSFPWSTFDPVSPALSRPFFRRNVPFSFL